MNLVESRPYWNRCQFDEQSRKGHYESYFLRANHPTENKAFWIRYTLFSPKGRPADNIGELWVMYFDADQNKFSDLDQARESLNILKEEIDALQKEYGNTSENTFVLGFSQGCMMSINLGLTSDQNYNCIVGFSGKIIDQNNLKGRIKNFSDVLLIHGDSDQVVPSTYLLEAKDFLIRNGINVKTLLIKNCDHHIPMEASSTALNYILKKI